MKVEYDWEASRSTLIAGRVAPAHSTHAWHCELSTGKAKSRRGMKVGLEGVGVVSFRAPTRLRRERLLAMRRPQASRRGTRRKHRGKEEADTSRRTRQWPCSRRDPAATAWACRLPRRRALNGAGPRPRHAGERQRGSNSPRGRHEPADSL
ncbi:hypothetical protein MTO96_022619 [Rhipicephalus appendiculatus]